MTENLTERYDGVVATFHPNPDDLKPTGLSKLKALYEELPDAVEGGALEKVGLTDEGFVVYRNLTNDVLVFGKLRVGPDEDVDAVSLLGHPDANRHSFPERYGTKYVITPDRPESSED